jgi:carboxylesterase
MRADTFLSTLFALAAGVGVVIVALAARTRMARHIEHETHTRLPRHQNGVVIGADAIELAGGDRAVLILHGFGDTPQSVRLLAERLHERAWTVHVPLLPGHGRSLGEFAASRASEWIAAARDAYASLRTTYGTVAVVGQSMGGALAILVAVEHPDIPAIVLLAPYLTMMEKVQRIAQQQRVLSLLVPYIRARTEASIWDPAEKAKSLGYGVTPPVLLAELAYITRAAWDIAPAVRVPTLMLQSRQDNRIHAADAQRVFDRLGGRPKELQWLQGCGHVIAVDHCRDQVWAETARWLRRFGGDDPASV